MLYVKKTNNLKDAITKGLDVIGATHQIRGKVVFIKPNFSYPIHKPGVTTTPALLREFVKQLWELDCYVVVGESDGGNNSFYAYDALKNHGIFKLAANQKCRVVELSIMPQRLLSSNSAWVGVPEMLVNGTVDYIINIPVLKVHAMTTVSLGLKNLWGLNPDTLRCVRHQNISHKLVMIAQALPPMFTVIDGINALNLHGPLYGEVVETNLIIMSNNIVEADSAGARIMGFNPMKIEHIRVAASCGLGNIDYTTKPWYHFKVKSTLLDRASKLLFNHDWLAELVMKSHLTPLLYWLAKWFQTRGEKTVSKVLNEAKS